MSGGTRSRSDHFILRIVLLIAVSTVFLTSSFVGLVAFMSTEISSVSSRLPWYVVIGAMSFVGSVVLLEEQGSDGRTIIVTSFVVTAVMFVLTLLSIEGVLFAIEQPQLVFNTQLILYFFSAALVGVGIGYWGLKHWREFTGQPTQNGL